MTKFTDLAIGDEDGVGKINRNFDAVEQTLNLEERKEIVLQLKNDWKIAHDGENPMKLIVTQGGALLLGDVQSKVAGSNAFSLDHVIATVPKEISFRGTTYTVGFNRFFTAPIGDRTKSTYNSVRIYLNSVGSLYVDETEDYTKGAPITINCYLDIKKKG